MHPDTRNIAGYMKDFGLHILGRAVADATFSETMKPFAHPLAVVHAAHGAEIILKARIAQEHPLLVFENLPKSGITAGDLTIAELLNHGRTIRYEDLPESLWATTGHRLAKSKEFLEFGRLRNQIMHFAVPDAKLAEATLRFCFEVIEPVVQDFWKESLVGYAEEWDDVIHSDGYLSEQLARLGIELARDG